MRRCLLVLLSLITLMQAQAGTLEAAAGFAVFQFSSDSGHLDLYWEIFPQSLRYQKDSLGRLSARIRTQIRVSRDTGIVYQDFYYLQTQAFDPSRETAPRILEQTHIPIQDGHYRVELYLAEDGREDSRFYYKDTLSVVRRAPQYSSLELLDTFFRSAVPSPFLKAGFQCLPMALNFYDEGRQNLHAYAELYRSDSLPASWFPLYQLCYISRERNGRSTGVYVSDTIRRPQSKQAFRFNLSTASLPTGNYWLCLALRTASGQELAQASTFFQTINAHPTGGKGIEILDSAEAKTVTDAHLLDLGKTFVAKFTMPQLRSILKMIRPAATGSEIAAINGFLERPDDLYMRYFIYNHFSLISPKDPDKAWEDFANEVREVNRQFGPGSTPGYETDRGIIWLRYGKPDEVIRVPNESGSLPYEIWRYNPNQKMHGAGLFLFYSPGVMRSDFRLLTSTVMGELQNTNWRQMLYVGAQQGELLNERAEEYFGKK
ncbi:MAG: GWxTD domain-containing protein [Bacteroidetes bacterium]|nr:GWxTD domain-containing protein [Bacteroidota bacterium]